ncbi:substrate-binding domain-containing protein [Marinomonas polaris]|uniref:Transcriptional regulator, LacI family n=1 Tax=Marinomonas polaris DSM 16579 TaxID=1122206 RepID=A0A1M4TD45_9GAMM|nr:substrate-binding domain-containing protein [Marinomonas polaris]SHE42288.1 transcriptional regulator, LacI family [Marinomonas polaris DSM 16579]
MTQQRPKNIASAAEVAKLAGVSRSAVSRTFTQGASVSKDTRERVLAAAAELNYHVNHLARGLSSEKSRPVCILGANLNAPYQASLLDALTQRLQLAGRAVMVINTSGGEASADAALRQTLNYRASATIVLSGTPQTTLIETCVQSGQQVILVNRAGQFEGTDHISIDYQSAMADAHHMLLRAGCQKLAVVSSTIQSPSLLTREKLFIQAAEDAKQACTLLRAGPTSYQTGVDAARRLLASRDRPDGVFCVTDLIACGFMDVAKNEFGLRIPEDICIVGFDDIEQASWLGYQLTTFSQPLGAMADAISTLLENASDKERKKQHLIFHAPPVWRHTVRPRAS